MTSYDPDVSASRELTTSSGVPRRRGAVNGVLLVLLGAWGALIPLIGPYFSLAYAPDTPWTFTADRLLLNILPGVAVVLGGLGLMATNRRGGGVFWGWLAAVGGAWFIVGPAISRLWNGGSPATGEPVGTSDAARVLTELAFHTGLGALIVFLAAVALGRFTIGERVLESHPDADEAQVDEDAARARLDESQWAEPQAVDPRGQVGRPVDPRGRLDQPLETRGPIDPRTHEVPEPRDVPQPIDVDEPPRRRR